MSGPSASESPASTSVGSQSPLERMLSKLQSKGDLPALGLTVSRTVRGSYSETEGLQTMANNILSDVSLTQRVLRIANGSVYRRPGTPPCTLVSKAVMVIGLSNVRAIALAAALLEGIKNKEQVTYLKLEFAKSFLASVMAREMARRRPHANAEALSIAALFKDLGRLLMASHDFETYKAIRDYAQANGVDEQSAATQILGTGFDSLGETMMREWHLPESIISATRSAAADSVGKGDPSPEEWARGAVTLSAEAASALTEPAGPARERAFSKMLHKHGATVSVDRARLDGLLATAGKESLDLAHGLGLPLLVAEAKAEEANEAFATAAAEAAAEVIPAHAVLKDAADPEVAPAKSAPASGASAEARADAVAARQSSHAILLAGIQEATRTLVSEKATLRDVITLVLEALYRGLGYDRVLVCLKNAAKGMYETRAALGDNQARLMADFRFSCDKGTDLFHVALERNVDVQILNAREPGIWSRLPNWHHGLLPDTRSFLMLPLVLNGKVLGFFYGDRDTVDEHNITKDELDLVKALKNQVLLAVKALR
jgi:HD-like signal output (HDOD) protein